MRRLFLSLLFITGILFTISCSQRRTPNIDSNTGLPPDPTNMDGNPSFGEGLGDIFSKSSQQASNGLTAADKEALSNMAKEAGEVEPEEEVALPPEIQAKLQELLKAEEAGSADPMMRMQVAAQIMAACGKAIGDLAPVPGETLMGVWEGKTCDMYFDKKGKPIDPEQPNDKGKLPKVKKTKLGAPLQFTVSMKNGPGLSEQRGLPAGHYFRGMASYNTNSGSGSYGGSPNASYGGILFRVGGDLDGTLEPSGPGDGVVMAEPWAGELEDQTKRGKLKNKKFNKTKYGYQSCDMGVVQKASYNRIPEKYVEAMRKAGKCFRQALFLFNPMMDKLFKNMDPALANMIRVKMLGVK